MLEMSEIELYVGQMRAQSHILVDLNKVFAYFSDLGNEKEFFSLKIKVFNIVIVP